MRIIIDGTVGCGKTSVILGESQRDSEHKRFLGLADLGYPVFTDLVINVIKHMRNSGINDPSQNWDIFFKIAVLHCINNYNNANVGTINFYDRGIYYLEIMAKRYGCTMPSEYDDFCSRFHYDNPVFIFEPIKSLDMTHPHSTDNKQKVYTWEDRVRQHHEIVKLYEKKGYETVIVPLKSDDPYRSNDYRVRFIKERLGI